VGGTAVKPQILMVDDDAQLLRSLERVLRRDAARWDITFALGGAAAVLRLREQVFDVVVSDFDMGSMMGSDVFAVAAESSPAALRIMLTAREGLVPWQVSAHLILTKPCSIDVLRGLIELRISQRDAGSR